MQSLTAPVAFAPLSTSRRSQRRAQSSSAAGPSRRRQLRSVAAAAQEEGKKNGEASSASAEEVTRKYGLEAGLWKVFTDKSGGDSPEATKKKTSQAGQLLKQYGSAYLITSISLSIVSFALCYFAIDAGVDVAALLKNVGIEVSGSGEQVGTAALAYAVHKAASPIRFPPTVALTPIVAKAIGKKPEGAEQN